VKKFILLSLLVLSQVLGDIWLSRGMKQFGEVNLTSPPTVLSLGVYLFTNPWIWLGIVFLVSSLFLYLIAISRLDLSYVLPIHSSSYVLNVLFAWLLLGERIPPIRWLSTFLISIGVLLVGISESESSNQLKQQNIKGKQGRNPFFLLPFGISLSKTWSVILLLVLADSSGDVLLAMGMKRVGKVQFQSMEQILKIVGQILTNPAIMGGVLCQAVAFGTFIAVLSWADISFVRPATALTYVFSLLGAKYILNEKIVTGKLIGIIFIGMGIFIHK
jgi:transporter family protein